MKVLKFGGSSLATTNAIVKVVSIIINASKHQNIIVVVSAIGATTDILIKAAHKAKAKDNTYTELIQRLENNHISIIKNLGLTNSKSNIISNVKEKFLELQKLCKGCYMIEDLTTKTLAKIMTYGEYLAAVIMAEVLNHESKTVFKDSRELIVTDNSYLNACVSFKETYINCQGYFTVNLNQIYVLPGFIAQSKQGNETTLGRGGSDYSAAIFAAALHAEELQIWTDVNGMFTANPAIVKQARPILEMSYEEAMEMSYFGAHVIYPPTIQPVLQKNITIRIKNTFNPKHPGTLISDKSKKKGAVTGISYIEDIALLTLEGSGMIGIPGISKRLFKVLANEHINVVLITQASSEHSICVGIYEKDVDTAISKIDLEFSFEIKQHAIHYTHAENHLSIIALIGDRMKNHQGLSGQMFSALGKNNVNIRAIAQGASEKNISAVIKQSDAKKALNTLHEQFFEEPIKQLNLFVMGVGNVGCQLLAQLHHQQKYLLEHLKLNLRVIGIANSKTMYFHSDGLNLEEWSLALDQGEPSSLLGFSHKIKALNLRNSIFIDNTASKAVSKLYPFLLQESIAVVTCNKIACAADLKYYKHIKHMSKEYGAPFLYETNVGAGLPIIDTLKNLVISGDRIHKIQAVLSGSLNFVFNHFNDKVSFHDIVKQAEEQGFTEPDPKIDLSGIDVARKILILARESGYTLELSDVENTSFLPEESLKTKNNLDFYASLKKHESHFRELFQHATEHQSKLKYVAEFTHGRASVGLQHIPENHPFYNLEGSDNIVLFFTDRYPIQPLQIKGAGAGAEVTASGIFADIIRIANS